MYRKLISLIVIVLVGVVGGGCTAENQVGSLPTPIPTLTSIPTLTPTPKLVAITVYFTDSNRYAVGTPPFEAAVTRTVPASANLAEAVLLAFFDGPTLEEGEQGLEAITSGFDGFSVLVIEDGIARLYLRGECASLGATYTVAQPIMKNLLQFPEVLYVKIYDENGETEIPEGDSNSIPFCLEP